MQVASSEVASLPLAQRWGEVIHLGLLSQRATEIEHCYCFNREQHSHCRSNSCLNKLNTDTGGHLSVLLPLLLSSFSEHFSLVAKKNTVLFVHKNFLKNALMFPVYQIRCTNTSFLMFHFFWQILSHKFPNVFLLYQFCFSNCPTLLSFMVFYFYIFNMWCVCQKHLGSSVNVCFSQSG